MKTNHHSAATSKMQVYHGRYHTKKQKHNEKPKRPLVNNSYKNLHAIASCVMKIGSTLECSKASPPRRRGLEGASEWPFIN